MSNVVDLSPIRDTKLPNRKLQHSYQCALPCERRELNWYTSQSDVKIEVHVEDDGV